MFAVYVALDVDLRERDTPPLAWVWPTNDVDGYSARSPRAGAPS